MVVFVVYGYSFSLSLRMSGEFSSVIGSLLKPVFCIFDIVVFILSAKAMIKLLISGIGASSFA